MAKFRKKPIVIEAVQWVGDWKEIQEFCKSAEDQDGNLLIPTLEGVMYANVNVGDWIIKGVSGEFYPCKPDIFEQTYEAVK